MVQVGQDRWQNVPSRQLVLSLYLPATVLVSFTTMNLPVWRKITT